MFKKIIISLILILNLSACLATETENLYLITAYVSDVHDGDTITYIKTNKDKKKIVLKGRLYGIDAPELQQEFGNESKEYLSELILNQNIYIHEMSTDIYGRSIVKLFIDEIYINEALVRLGYAWSYKEYNNNNFILNEAETKARTNRLGLWNTSSPIYPSHWRKLRKFGNSIVINSNCDYTVTCSKIKTCDEAMRLLNECNFYFLDGNADGIPCETVCKK